jgi:hypothetical protein
VIAGMGESRDVAVDRIPGACGAEQWADAFGGGEVQGGDVDTAEHAGAGTAHVFGHDIARDADAVRGRITLTGQHASVDDALTGAENLVVLGRLLGHTHTRA